MLRIKEFKKTFSILFTRYKPIDFNQMEEDRRNKARLYVQELKNTKEIGKWMDKTRELSRFLKESRDPNARFFSSQLKLVTSGVEDLRSSICNKENPLYFEKNYQEYFDNLLEKLDVEAITCPEHLEGDALRGLYLSSKLYHGLLKDSRVPPSITTSSEVLSEMKKVGKRTTNKPSIKPFYDFFSAYANRPIANDPELTFVTAYLYKIFGEVLYSNKGFTGLEERNKFISSFGEKMSKIGKALEIDNPFGVYYNLSELYHLAEGI